MEQRMEIPITTQIVNVILILFTFATWALFIAGGIIAVMILLKRWQISRSAKYKRWLQF